MKLKRRACCLPLSLGLALAICLAAQAAEKSIKLPDDNPMGQLKPGPNVDVVRNHCIICHSTDYIVRQPASDTKKWEGEVQKMIKVYGAPISEADAKAIVEYLATAYGENGEKGEEGKRQKGGGTSVLSHEKLDNAERAGNPLTPSRMTYAVFQ